MSAINEETSRKLSNASFLAAVLIVLYHCAIPSDQGWLSEAYRRFVRFGICEAAVPYFFVASGFFLAGRYLSESLVATWKTALRKRVGSLLVPYLIFCALAFSLKGMCDGSISQLNCGALIDAVGLNPLTYPAYKLLWYVRNLYLLVLVSPLIALGVRKSKRMAVVLVLLVGALQVAYVALSARGVLPSWMQGVFGITFRVRSLFYFAIGFALRFWRTDLDFGKIVGWCALMVGFVWCGLFPRSSLTSVAYPFFVLGGVALVPGCSWPGVLVRNAFALYLWHGILLYGVRLLPSRLVKGVGGTLICCFLVTVASVMIAELLRRWLPKVARVMLGGR